LTWSIKRRLTFVIWAAVPQDCGVGSPWAVVCFPVLEVVLPDYLLGERHPKDVHGLQHVVEYACVVAGFADAG
jgi:hypothetical protein